MPKGFAGGFYFHIDKILRRDEQQRRIQHVQHEHAPCSQFYIHVIGEVIG